MLHRVSRSGALRLVLTPALALSALAGASRLAAQGPALRLSLQEAVELARQRGSAAIQARETFDAARWRDRAFNGRMLPQISLTGTVPSMNRSIIPVTQPDGTTEFVPQRQTESSLALNFTQRIPFTGGDLTVSSDLTRIDRFGQTDSRLWRSTPLQISLRQSILRGNPLAWDGREQDLRLRVAERQLVEAMEDVSTSALAVFFDAYAAEFAVRNAMNQVALNDSLYNTAKGRYAVGRIGENELLQSELALLRAQNTLDGARLQQGRTLAALKIALKIPEDVPVELVPPTEIPNIAVDTTKAIAEALRNRSQVVDLELQEVQARRRVSDLRRSTGMGATLTASAGFNQAGPFVDDAYRSLLQQQRFGLSVTVPLFLGGSRSAEIEAVRADERRVAAAIENTRLTMRHEVRYAVLEIALARRQVMASAKADTVSELRAESAKNRYLIGRIPINEFYQAQSERENVLQQYMQALRSYWNAYYRLRRLTLYDFARDERILRE